MRFLKGSAADLEWYLGPQSSIDKILAKLDVVYVMVASFDVLMKSFYKLQQGKSERVPAFITRLEEAMSHIRIEHLRRLGEQQALRNL